MNQGFGMESASTQAHTLLRKAARYLLLTDSGGNTVARLFLDPREQIAEFDASTEETSSMTSGQVSTKGAEGAEWDPALAGHSAVERAGAHVYQLTV
jgi:hypothetical protein